MTREQRINREVRLAVRALHYIARCEDAGQDVSRLAEKREKSTACLVRHARCFCCGAAVENPVSVKAWELDRLGPVCRERLAKAAA